MSGGSIAACSVEREIHVGKLIDSLIQRQPAIEQDLGALIPIMRDDDCEMFGIAEFPYSTIRAGWRVQSLGVLLTYEEALLLIWGFSTSEILEAFEAHKSPSFDQIAATAMSIIRIAIGIEILTCPKDHGAAWANRPQPVFGDRSPKELILAGRMGEIETYIAGEMYS